MKKLLLGLITVTNFCFADQFIKDLVPYRIDNKWGFSNLDRQIKIPVIYDFVDLFSEDYAKVKKDGKYGYIDKNGNVKIPIKYKEAASFCKGLALVRTESDKYQLINKMGKVIKVLDYDTAYLHNEYYIVSLNNKFGLLNANGKIFINLNYDDISYPAENMIGVSKNGKWGYIDFRDKLVIPYQYSLIGPYNEGFARVCKNIQSKQHCGVLDKQGNLSVELKYDWINDCREGLCPAELNNQWGYINPQGTTIIPFQYTHADSFHEGLAAIDYYTKNAYIDKNGNIKIPFKYSNAQDFKHGLASVTLNQYMDINQGGYIDINGNNYFEDTKPVAQFGINLIGAKRSEVRKALKQIGFSIIREDNSYWYDLYTPTSNIPDVSQIKIGYSTSGNLAEVTYTISNSNNDDTVTNVEKTLNAKYGEKTSYTAYNQWLYAGIIIRTTKEGAYKTTLSYRTIDFSVMEGEFRDQEEKQKINKVKTMESFL